MDFKELDESFERLFDAFTATSKDVSIWIKDKNYSDDRVKGVVAKVGELRAKLNEMESEVLEFDHN